MAVSHHDATPLTGNNSVHHVRRRNPKTMASRRRRHTPEQIIRKLREGEKQLGQGVELPEVLKYLEITEATW